MTEVTEAVMEMSRSRIGALIVFERSTGLRSYVETGTAIHARVSKDLLVTIFYSQNPLHDGAVIIKNKTIEAARCILPVSTSMRLSPHLGLRHRSAVGLTEQTDAFVVVVSEETGQVSVSTLGNLISDIDERRLREYLTDALLPQAPAPVSLSHPDVEPAATFSHAPKIITILCHPKTGSIGAVGRGSSSRSGRRGSATAGSCRLSTACRGTCS